MRNTFGRQAIPMVWDYAECCPFSDYSGNWIASINWVWKVIEKSFNIADVKVIQHDATLEHKNDLINKIISSDPPYYDAVPYADLSDFFYVWLRCSVGSIYPEIFNTLLVPKAQELVADNFRHGSKTKAKKFGKTLSKAEQQGFIDTLEEMRQGWGDLLSIEGRSLDMTKTKEIVKGRIKIGPSTFDRWKELLPKTLNDRLDVGYRVFKNNPIKLADNVEPAKELIKQEEKNIKSYY